MDETDSPQTPPELLVILAAIADEGIPAQTIAPKFTGRFNKGVDYVGDLAQFEKEFHDDLAVIALRHRALRPAGEPEAQRPQRQRQVFALPDHPPHAAEIRRRAAHQDGGHDLAGGTDRPRGSGRRRARAREGNLRRRASSTWTNSARPMRPSSTSTGRSCRARSEVAGWTSEQITGALRHDQKHPLFNAELPPTPARLLQARRQAGPRYLDLLKANEEIVGKNVTENLYERHLKPLFVG